MASSIFNLGEALGSLLTRPQDKRIQSYLPSGYDTVRDLNKTLDSNRASNLNDYNNYFSAFNSASPQFSKVNQSNIDYLDQILNRNVDSSANYKDLLGFNLGQLNNQQNVLDQAGSRNDNLALAALGLGGSAGGGSYGSLARTNRISANTVPILNTIFANTGQTAQSVSDQNYRNTLMNLGLLDTRASMVDNPANRLLAPSGVRNQMLGSDTNLLNGIVNAMKNNVLGIQDNPGFGEKFSGAIKAVDKSLNSAVDTGLSMYSGGMLGGAPSDRMDAQAGAGAYRGMGGGQQGGGFNIQQIMQMLGQTGRGGGGYASGYERPNYGGYSGVSDFNF